eukprot:Gregarina_sp_Poly_1__4360@NODE_235_length_10966_cov_193_557758_g208_i0_p4_GENE_NODE_235_length_10966_cov_193_557758_g208_i0NODE_235_length_10966_cov_193_557758_g208_i0_p4_ORF_typecomplete_len237_score36_33Mlf1IP/PF10248_9/3_9e16_NODE_235_length_10966_cov_193_557758_g208_i020712781
MLRCTSNNLNSFLGTFSLLTRAMWSDFFGRRSMALQDETSRTNSREEQLASRDETSNLLSSWMSPSAMMQSFFGRRRIFDDDPFFGSSSSGFGTNAMMDNFMSPDRFAEFSEMTVPKKGQYSSQMMFTSTEIGPDGQPRTKRYLHHTHGDADKQLRQTRQAFSDTGDGTDRYAMERHIGSKARRVVRERNRVSGAENQTDTLQGLTEEELQRFDSQWSRMANHLQHGNHEFPRALQ